MKPTRPLADACWRTLGASGVDRWLSSRLASIHEDTDDDQDVDASDKWFHHAFDERWRWVATFRENDTDPKEEYLHHAAGLDGEGTGSYIDLVIYRDRDINSGWTSAADGTMEERIYYCQNWRADVSAIVTREGQMLEWVKYSSYGVPFGLPGGDTNSDGDCDAGDVTQVDTWSESTTYDVRGDIDLNGVVDEDDSSTIQSQFQGTALGRALLSPAWIRNCLGGRGYQRTGGATSVTKFQAHGKVIDVLLGRSLVRESLSAVLSGPDNAYSVSIDEDSSAQRSSQANGMKLGGTSQAGGQSESAINYGNWCGVGNSKSSEYFAKDDLDACCFQHDACWMSSGITISTANVEDCAKTSLAQLYCDCKFCQCLKGVKPDSFAKAMYLAYAMPIFCRCCHLIIIPVPLPFH